MHNYYLFLVLKQRTFWCFGKEHIKIRVKSKHIDLHALSMLKQHTWFYSEGSNFIGFWIFRKIDVIASTLRYFLD